MKGKLAFVLGAGVGYLLGTRAGRQQYEKLKSVGRSAWENPKVQERVQQAESKIGDVVREQGSQVTDKVAGLVKNTFSSGSGGGAAEGSTSSWDTPSPTPDTGPATSFPPESTEPGNR